eukprot:14069046-Alexandrium_andersonii.AAC.1
MAMSSRKERSRKDSESPHSPSGKTRMGGEAAEQGSMVQRPAASRRATMAETADWWSSMNNFGAQGSPCLTPLEVDTEMRELLCLTQEPSWRARRRSCAS